MTGTTYNLSSRTSQRIVRKCASSGGISGLEINDIVQLVDPRQTAPEERLVLSRPLVERVFKALADAKIWTSSVVMHMDRASRDRYFRQLDFLHDCDEWVGDEQPIVIESYKSFIRFMLTINGNSKPSLALAPKGYLLAVWETNGDRLTVEFVSDDKVEWIVSRHINGRVERAAGTTSRDRLEANLAPYNPNGWFAFG
jgi:hypothetical protein